MNKTRTTATAGLLAVALVAATDANAMRCGTRLIARGDHVSKLLRYCGEPDFAQTRLAHRSYSNRFGDVLYTGFHEEVRIDEWTYNLGPNKLVRVVKMENGVVREIRHLGYGYH
ncbi:MAG TPA: DUF2845 domain-containing protein [Gammaproteobacteria bacterium]